MMHITNQYNSNATHELTHEVSHEVALVANSNPPKPPPEHRSIPYLEYLLPFFVPKDVCILARVSTFLKTQVTVDQKKIPAY